MVIPADKSHKLYKVPVQHYKKMVRNAVTETYKKCSHNEVSKVNSDTLKLVEVHEPGLETKVEVFTQAEAFVTIKDHKDNFPSKADVRLLNPAKPQLGIITKVKLQSINNEIRMKTRLNQLQSSKDAIAWFSNLKYKRQRYFVIFDVEQFYPSISEEILKKTFKWARTIVPITKADENLIFMARQSFLFMDNEPWVKKKSKFDVTMGSYDGAQVAEFVGLFLLNNLLDIMNISDYALYRDDGICAIRGNKSEADDIRKKIKAIFKNVGLKIDTPSTCPSKSVDFLDLNFNLTTGFYSPYRKPLNEPLFIHKNSNHPPSMIREIPRMVCKRLSTNSSNK